MVERHQNICVVGDDDQSIYRWRGAEVGNILNFEKDFPKTKVITLEQNYRSTQNILRAANDMVRKNRSRKEKVLWTENPEGELIILYAAEDESDEAQFVVQKIVEQCSPRGRVLSTSSMGVPGGSDRPFRDMAIFYRINAQSRPIEDELVKYQIPYTIVGGLKFYERKEIKDILAYLKLIANPSDGLSLKRIINVPSRGIGEKTIEKIETFSREKGIPLYEGMKQSLEENWLPAGVKVKTGEFVDLMEKLRDEAGTLLLSQLTLDLLAKTGYLPRLKEEGTDEAFSKIENIDELINVMMELEQGGEGISLESFLDKVSLVSDVDLYEDKGNRVSLMTLHCAKGLEFPFVFIVGMEEGLLPHYRRGDEIEDLEEERRLCYVGITRAKERIFLSRAEKRSTFGVGRANLPSRFLEELPMELMQLEERQGKMETLFSQGSSMVDQRADGSTHISWDHHFQQAEQGEEDLTKEHVFSGRQEMVLSPVDETRPWEEFFQLRVGMKVRHPKFGEGRVRSIEGMNEDQKATIVFQTVGSRRLKVRYANLEILE
jgi:DNA helicase-2/ATP-dependent DNA helicase PcrA